jgi:hypothetical protein
VPALAKLTQESIPFFRNEIRPASSCVANIILPWSHLTVPDPNFNASNGFPPRQVYVEGVDYLPGLAGESRNFDANGPYIRVLGAGGTLTYSLQPGLFGQSLTQLSAAQPQVPPGGLRPPYKENVPCETQAPITDLSAPSSAPLKSVGGSPVSPATLPPALQSLLPLLPVSLAVKTEQQQTLTMVKRALAGSGLKLHMSGTTKP